MWSIFSFYLRMEFNMSKKQPNNFLAPFVIAGITAGFFISAYRFVFAKPIEKSRQKESDNSENQAPHTEVQKD